MPGLRSGFVAGDPVVLKRFLLYRTYHGSAMPVPTQLASCAAWRDDAPRRGQSPLYQEKFARVLPLLAPVLEVSAPAGAFYLWPDVGGDDEPFARELYAREHLTVLPGSYLGRARARAQSGRRARAHLAGARGGAVRRGRHAAARVSVPPLARPTCHAARPRARLPRMTELAVLRDLIDAAFERRAELTPQNVPEQVDAAIEACLTLLDSGAARVAEPLGGEWIVNEWLKKAVLLYFRMRDNRVMDAGYTRFYDKVPLKYAQASEAQLREGGARIVPHAVVRRGAYIAPNVVLMPSYVNIGA